MPNAASSGGNSGKSGNGPNSGNGQKPRNTKPVDRGKRVREESKLKQEVTQDDIEDVSFVPSQRMPKQRQDPLQHYTLEEVEKTGKLFESPETLGFLKRRLEFPKRAVPRYMLTQPRLLTAPPFQPNGWDSANQQKMLEIESQNSGSDYQGIYEVLQKMRVGERKKMEELGLVDAENVTKDLNDAIFFQGTCLDMCPTFERVRRALENNVKSLERDPATNKISRDRAIKAFSRPAAGQPPPIPSDVRPAHVLVSTLNFLVDNILPQLPDAHSFIWDRTRSIRQDFVYQNYYGSEAIDCNERIVRIHLVSLHIMSGSGMEYSQQQELEQFNKALQTLTESYQDVRNHGGTCPNEAEMRAYHLISHFRDSEIEREVQTLPDAVVKHRLVQLALRFRFIMSQNNIVARGAQNSIGAMNMFVEFFRLVYSDETPILMAFLLESHFNEFRFYALKAMSRSYHTKGKALFARTLLDMLGFDDVDQFVDYIQYYEVDTFIEDGEVLVDLVNKTKLESKYKLRSLQDKPRMAQAFSRRLDAKLSQMLLKSIVDSGLPNGDLKLGQQRKYAIPTIERKFPPVKPVALAPISDPTRNDKPAFGQTVSGQPAPTFLFKQDSAQDASKSKSFNIADFLNSQKGNVASQAPFGSVTPVNTVNLEKPATAPKFEFKSLECTRPKKAVHFQSPELKEKQEKPPPLQGEIKETPKPTELPSIRLLESKILNFAPQKSQLDVAAVKKAPVEETRSLPNKVSLKDSPNFSKAVGDVYNSILTDVIDTELGKLLPRIIKYENRKNERMKVVDALTAELYLAFLSELTYETLQSNYAAKLYERKIIKKAWKLWENSHSKKKLEKELKLRKLAELSSIEFKVPTLKRVHSLQGGAPKKRSLSRNTSFDIQERQEEIHKLWQPLDLVEFVRRCSKNVKIPVTTELKCLLIVEDWKSPYSKWLNTKFALHTSKDKTHYENRVESDGMVVSFESLPRNNTLHEAMFRSTGFIVVECGILLDERPSKSLHDKLERDGQILRKIVQICERYCLYQTHIAVLVWDTQSPKVDLTEASSVLKIDEIKSSVCVQDVVLCDMSALSSVIENLQSAVFGMGDLFSGGLTPRGMRKKLKMQKQAEESRLESLSDPKAAQRALEQKEKEVLRRARELQKHQYLSRHIVAGNDTTNNSFRTPNASFATLVNFNNSTTAFRNTTLLNASVRNTSLLSIGNASILEESTPFGSPKPAKSGPRKVQELRDLTAAIRSRYKK